MLYDINDMWNFKKPNSQNQNAEWWLLGVGRWVNGGDVGQRAQTCSLKMNEFWRLNAQHCNYSQPHCIVNFKAAKRLDHKCSHPKNK